MKKIIYNIVSPVLRSIYKSSVTSKKILGTNYSLFYNKSQHLNFLFKREINYEREFRVQMLDVIKENDLVFEIGSNIGQHSLLISDKIGPKGKLICIEPDSSNYAFLMFNVLKNKCKNIELLRLAVSDHPGKTIFYKDTVTGGRMSSLIQNYTGNNFEGNMEEVELITMDDLVKKYGIPDFVKVDVEGAENLVFPDNVVLNTDTKYVIEVRKETKDIIFNQFKREGFQIYLMDSGMKEVKHQQEIPGFANLLIKKI